MPAFTSIALGASVLLGAGSSISGASKAKKAERQARRDQQKVQRQIASYQRQQLNNPFGNVTNQFEGLQNTLQGQQVGLQGAEFASQQYDQNLANILDTTVQGGGGSASTATALARESRLFAQQQGAGIQQQELSNQRAAAQQGFQIQTLQAQGAERAQTLKAQGEQYLTGIREQRDSANLQGLGQQLSNAQYAATSAAQARAQQNAALTQGLFGAAASFAGGSFGGNTPQVSSVNAGITPSPVQSFSPAITAPIFKG